MTTTGDEPMLPNIYRLNECEWIAATSLDEAIAWYLEMTGVSLEEGVDDPIELSEADLDRLQFTTDDDTKHSFRVQRDLYAAEECDVPYLFASTED